MQRNPPENVLAPGLHPDLLLLGVLKRFPRSDNYSGCGRLAARYGQVAPYFVAKIDSFPQLV